MQPEQSAPYAARLVPSAHGFMVMPYREAVSGAENTDHLRNKRWEHFPNAALPEDEPYWDAIKRGDVILHVPYESYNPVVKFLNDAADDPDVLSIKMTLYRTGRGSPIISALEKAARTESK